MTSEPGRRRPLLLLALVPLAAVAACACAWVLSSSARGARPRPNVILISIDTLRADHLGCYGYDPPTSPAIDRFRGDAVLFREAIAHAPSTLPSHASIFTSLVPQHHGAVVTEARPLPKAAVTLTEVLRDSGYATRAVVSGAQLARPYGLAQGFGTYREVDFDSPFKKVVAEGLKLADRTREPFFLFLHTYEVHHPYTPEAERLARFDQGYTGDLPDHMPIRLLSEISMEKRRIGPEDLKHIVATYDAEISSVDDAFAELVAGLERRGLYDDSLIVLTSDHGEEFGEHGSVGWHAHTLYDELLHVPLLVKLPGQAHAGSEVASAVRGIDLAPTVLAVAGLTAPEQFSGRSLLPFMRRPEAPALPAVVWRETMSHEKGDFTGVRAGGWKLHMNRLYDLRNDPLERRDLTAEHPEERRELEEHLATVLRSRRSLRTAPVAIDAATRKSLRALGYLR
jgi:arylsulfatase A-like enzyme